MLTRKKETERIEKENHAFAKRLFDKQAVLNKKALDVDWRNHIKYKRQITKMPPLPKTRLIVTESMRRSHNQIVEGSQMGHQQPPLLNAEIDPNVMNVVQPDDDARMNQHSPLDNTDSKNNESAQLAAPATN